MAVKFKFASAILCERVLQEVDGAASAIRIADVFQLPHNAPEQPTIQFSAIISLKTVPAPDTEFRLSVFMTGPSGKKDRLPDPPGNPFKAAPYQGDLSIPTGITIVLQLSVVVQKTGTAYIDIEVDDEPAITIPFTTLRLPPPPTTESMN
jgi:hypothetical protein